MVVLVGRQLRENDDIWAGQSVCPQCGKTANFHLRRKVARGTVFFVPIFSITTGRMLVCDSCGWTKKLSGSEYSNIKKKQIQLFNEGKFPKNIIRLDCHPEEVKYVRKFLATVVLGLISAFYLLIGLLSTIKEVAETGEYGGFLLIAIVVTPFAIPFAFCLKNLLFAHKQRKAYKALTYEE